MKTRAQNQLEELTKKQLKDSFTIRSVPRTPQGAYKLLDIFEKKGLAPLVDWKAPFWLPSVGPQLREVFELAHVPVLDWSRRLPADGTPMTSVDANAAYIAAASSAVFAHGALENFGAFDLPAGAPIPPGYYLVDVYPWSLGAPGSPLGAQEVDGSRVWVTHVTYGMLRDLVYGSHWTPGGHWPDVTFYDSFVSQTKMRMTDWTDVIRDMRASCIDLGDRAAYEAVKLGYSQAIQMWGIAPDPKGTAPKDRKKHNLAWRPDWVHTIHSQHAFNMFRRAYQATVAGRPPYIVGGPGHLTDGMAFQTSDLTAILAATKSPFRLDATTKSLGTFKVSRRWYAGMDEVDEA